MVGYPLQIFTIYEEDKFILSNEDTLKSLFLQEDMKDRNVSIISIAGAIRTGKSFLLNIFIQYLNSKYTLMKEDKNMIEDRETKLDGFAWSGGPGKITKGIYIWTEFFKVTLENGERVAVILLDTQGLNDMGKTLEDKIIFALSSMLSSLQIFNLSQCLLEDDLQNLNIFTEYGYLTKSDLKPFQNLIVLIRDWGHSSYGIQYGADGGNVVLDERFNIIQNNNVSEVRHIQEMFEKLTCFLLPHPGLGVVDSTFGARLIDTCDEFIEYIEKLTKNIFEPQNLVLKKKNGKNLTASEFFTLLQKYSQIFKMKKMQISNIFSMKTDEDDVNSHERFLYQLEKNLQGSIVGQTDAVRTVAEAINRRENGWCDDERPLVFMFLGSSGIGKTELAKQIAHYVHKHNKEAFFRLDMSEYQRRHEISKMIGSPPGYLGYDDGGQLTGHLTKHANSVVLFDEIEKAHPDCLTILLQLFDEGRLTDGKGKVVECKMAIFVMTSNLASEEIASHVRNLRNESKQAEESSHTNQLHISDIFKDSVVRPILKKHFKRDEFLGRINYMVYFLPFSKEELIALMEIEMLKWKLRIKKRRSIKLKWEQEVLSILCDSCDSRYGARSVKNEIEKQIISKLALADAKNKLQDVAAVMFAIDENGEISIKIKKNGGVTFVILE